MSSKNCSFCLIENGKTKLASKTIGTHISYNDVKGSVYFKRYNIDCCEECHEFYELQENYLHGVERDWLHQLYEKIHSILTSK